MNLLPLIVIFPLIMAIIFNLIHGKDRAIKYLTFIVALSLLILPFLGSYGYYYFGGHGYIESYISGIAYYYNDFKKIIILVLSLIASLVLITGMGEKIKNNMFVVFSLMGFASVSAIVLTDDLFNLYVFFEILAMVQVGLVFLSGTEESYKAGLRYLIIGTVAGSLMLLGIGLLLAVTGTLNITDMKKAIINSPIVYTALFLIIVGYAYGSGLPPFHNIKADLYGRSKAFISALLQTFSKFTLVGIILIILKLFSSLSIFPTAKGILLALGVLGMVFGVVMALTQSDYKRLLAYHAISQGGYVATGLALGTPLGIVAGVFHAINHVIYKSALFIGAYIVNRCGGSNNLYKLGGLITAIPFVALLILFAKLAISGVPPFNGFQSKLLLAEAAMEANLPEIAIIMIFVSIGTFVSMMKAFYLIFLKPGKEVENVEVPKLALISLFILVSLCILLGLYPELVTNYLWKYAKVISG
ncbi:hypothetical protein Metin_0637 [Methanocaldococcus infernus ME]|uniref:NADH:quinone oxidoreductase/Mrp antiporter transmembrane domain-containing protein n=1 Tax=Methanocaldococcus infernus (strain DSM 11812 / JCM 15783 / ME) TaxID=573063 RepID=D5VRV3_METIM|nr:energy conserving hydrogenase EhbF [Methanocaldococcus infernus]ADG13306.1 hypothetical protein Metin_0637 [Methanocaldococcus infernus ME]